MLKQFALAVLLSGAAFSQTQAPVVHYLEQLDEIRKIECKVPKGFGCAILFASVICGVRQLSLIFDGTLYTVVYGPPLKRDDRFCGLRRNVRIPARVEGENLIVRWPDGTEEKGKIIRRERIDPNRPQPA